MNRLVKMFGVLLVMSGLIGFQDNATLANDSKAPNVLFIAVDDLNDWVGYLGGHPQGHTPNIDTLAKEAAAFTHAYCPAPVCGPSRTALMYGVFPHKSGSYGHHEIYTPGNLIPKEQLPLNLAFQNNGYYTAGCGKIFHYPEKRGWDEYRRQINGVASKTKEKLGKGIQLGFGILDTDNDSDTGDGKLTDWAIEQLQRQHDKPFFIALGLNKPHLPWDAPKKYFDRLNLKTIQLPHVPADDLADLPEAGKLFARAKVGFSRLDDHKAITEVDGAWEKLVRAYLATSTFADANVGRVLDALNKSAYSENTIIVLWGDHGWHLGEKNHWRKMSLWERGTRTPFIIKIPGAKANGKRINAPVSLQDIFPTLVDLCGIQIDQKLDGNSLKPLLMDPSAEWNKPVVISHGPGNFAVRKGTWRLIHYADGSEELYDIEADPGEFSNLAGSPENQSKRLELQKHVPKTWRYVMGQRFKNFPNSFAEPTQ
jgi:arylsulfatase A-like enzyme